MEYRVTKYNPANRNELGHYLNSEEWTEFADVGHSVSLEEYERTENAYIETALEFISNSGINELKVVELEDNNLKSNYKENDIVKNKAISDILRSLLRSELWCKLESEYGFIHIGWDYYMYLGLSHVGNKVIENAGNRGLYVESYSSPYHT